MATDPDRGTGRTTKQMQEAPQGAVFVVAGNKSAFQEIARRIGRTDLMLTPIYDLHVLRGRRLSGIVVDHHATDVATLAALAEIDSLRAYIGRGDA